MIENIKISIIKNPETDKQETIDITTNGYVLLFLKGDKVKTSGDIELKALAPLLMKVVMEKMSSA